MEEEKHIDKFCDNTKTQKFIHENTDRLLAWEYLQAQVWKDQLSMDELIDKCGLNKSTICGIINKLKKTQCMQKNKN